MALRDQPYIPLYVQDYLTDEKLNACSPATQGVYIKMMCLFHKCDPYGGILLKQKDKQNPSICYNFAYKLACLLPFNLIDIQSAVEELIDEKVLFIDGDFLYQKRMVKDNELSSKRANSGKNGGKRTQSKNKDFALNFAKAKQEAKNEQNTEYEIEYEIENNKEKKKGVTGGRKNKPEPLNFPFSSPEFMDSWKILISTSKWKKKIPHSLQLALNSLGRYQEEFAIQLINKAIENGWQGVTYPDTDEQYQKWLNGHSKIRTADNSNRKNTAGYNAEDKKRSVSDLAEMAEGVLQNLVPENIQ